VTWLLLLRDIKALKRAGVAITRSTHDATGAHQFFCLAAVTAWAADLFIITEDQFFKAAVAGFALIFVYGHFRTPCPNF
jgi:hypothetical protein